jgi:hypothetical protein
MMSSRVLDTRLWVLGLAPGYSHAYKQLCWPPHKVWAPATAVRVVQPATLVVCMLLQALCMELQPGFVACAL